MTARILWEIFAFVLGCYTGYAAQEWRQRSKRLEREVHEVRRMIEQPETPENPDAEAVEDAPDTTNKNRRRVWPTMRRLATPVALVATATAAFLASDFVQQAEDRQHDFAVAQHNSDVQKACQQGLIEETIQALTARSQFGEQQAKVTLQYLRAQAKFLGGLAAQQSRADGMAAFQNYLEALHVAITATKEQLEIRVTHPYPTRKEVLACGK